MRNCIILLSGGLDSTTTLAIANKQGYGCYALSFNYGQRNLTELNAAQKIARHFTTIKHLVITLDWPLIDGSALTDQNIPLPKMPSKDLPVTYVPARNTIFLSYALAWAEILGLKDIFIGVNSIDYPGYPDCRTEYINAYESLANLATRMGTEEGKTITIHAPLICLTKAQIIKTGTDLEIDYAMTVSCYQADEQGRACGACEACSFRKTGFETAQIKDPTIYQNNC